MPKGPVRRAQLIAPFGVGAMLVTRDGTSLVTAGLDHWYQREAGESDPVDHEEYIIEEWRLQKELGVKELRLPPDYRDPRLNAGAPNAGLTIPFQRFPQVHFCPFCHLLVERPLSLRERPECPECKEKGKRRFLRQVPVVAICEHGHLQDFPWRAWVHQSEDNPCEQKLRLIATGGASLGAQLVRCDCGKERTLRGATGRALQVVRDDEHSRFRCVGHRPWLGKDASEHCSEPLRGSLRNASNLYFAQVRSSLYLPRGSGALPDELVDLLGNVKIQSMIEMLESSGLEVQPHHLRKQFKVQFSAYADEQIVAALKLRKGEAAPEQALTQALEGDDWQTGFRRAEYDVLQSERDEKLLRIRAGTLADYDRVKDYFTKVMLVDKLKETRALVGFTRVYPETERTVGQLKAMMWRTPPIEDSWLPAYEVFGEGIFVTLDEKRLQQWEGQQLVQDRIAHLAANFERVRIERKIRERAITPRFVLLHTLAHLLVNRLTFECGYSSASLRERLYVSTNPDARMAGLLIYTAAGDSEGTMGGLVRMGKPGHFESVLFRALEEATWCSADPFCMELGEVGQGPGSCNLAACHNCALVPETACEEFNHFLDRAVVIGDLARPELGYFTFKSPSLLD